METIAFNRNDRFALWRGGIVNLRRFLACAVIVSGSLLLSCSSDNNKGIVPDEEEEGYGAESGKVALKLLSGTSQQGRVKSLVSTRSILNKEALTYVATIGNPTYQADDKKWSATAIAIDDAKNRVYITWHSDRQAQHAAEVWGGAIDVVNIENEDRPSVTETGFSTDIKFNHVLIHGDQLFLGATSAQISGAVGRVALTAGGDIPENTETVDRIGFPGISVNAVAEYGDRLIAVSGHAKGTYGTFAPDIEAIPYYYGKREDLKNTDITVLHDEMEDFGGKYIAADENGKVYVLYNKTGENAKILNVSDNSVIALDTPLVSGKKFAETYDYELGEWILSGEQVDYYGKHTFAVRGGYAYVACGKNGLRVYDLTNGSAPAWKNRTYTIGVCADEEYLYTSTGAGLRIYRMKAGGELGLVAFEVENYDEKENGTGAPIIKGDNDETLGAAETGTAKRHSPNFVAVHPKGDNTYIYIAYGQSGVRVYKFTGSEFLVELDPYIGINLEPFFGL